MKRRIPTRAVLGLMVSLGSARPAPAQVSSCQAVYGDRGTTVEFARRSSEVSRALFGHVGVSNDAVALLERCLAAEFSSCAEAEPCRRAFVRLQDAGSSLTALELAMDRLLAVHRQDRTLAVYDDALAKILRDSPIKPVRVRKQGHRFAPAAGRAPGDPPDPHGLTEILEFQRADVALVRRAIEAAVEAFRSSLPAAEKRDLAASVYSGRSPLLSRMLEATEQLETYRRFHFEACRATVAATGQVYPAGLQWLEEPAAERHVFP